MTESRLGAAVIGCGGIGEAHARALSLMPEVRIVAACDAAAADHSGARRGQTRARPETDGIEPDRGGRDDRGGRTRSEEADDIVLRVLPPGVQTGQRDRKSVV